MKRKLTSISILLILALLIIMFTGCSPSSDNTPTSSLEPNNNGTEAPGSVGQELVIWEHTP